MIEEPFVVATSGAAGDAPGATGWAWVAADGHWCAGAIRDGAEHIGDLTALLHAVLDNAGAPGLTVSTDCLYAITICRALMRTGGSQSSKGGSDYGGGGSRSVLELLEAVRAVRGVTGLGALEFQHIRLDERHALNLWAEDRAKRAAAQATAGSTGMWSSHHGQPKLDVIEPPEPAELTGRR